MPYKDKQKQKEYSKEHNRKYQKENRDKRNASTKKWSDKNRKKIIELKEKPCADCGIQYPYYVMQFDHVRGIKEDKVSTLVKQRLYKKAFEEIEKCEVVCANCHATRTWERSVI